MGARKHNRSVIRKKGGVGVGGGGGGGWGGWGGSGGGLKRSSPITQRERADFEAESRINPLNEAERIAGEREQTAAPRA